MGLIEVLRDAFGWQDVQPTLGPRGALGRVWRVTADGEQFAVKELFFDPPPAAVIEAELILARRAAEAGVRSPRSTPDRDGRHLVPGPDGRWLRVYEWVDLQPVNLAAPQTPGRLGELVARLHQCAPAATLEPGGDPPARWYDQVPSGSAFAPALASGAAWVPRLAARLSALPALAVIVTPADPSRLRLCHRDLHPGNVLADQAGAPVVVDWDQIGPADPARELAAMLFDWWCDPSVDSGAMRAMYDGYRQAGGPARITRLSDFSMLVASRLNFLRKQLTIAADTSQSLEHRQWAEAEIDEALRILPTPEQLSEVLSLTRASG